MNEQVKNHIEKYPSEIVHMFKVLRELIYDGISTNLIETLWSNMPSYYVGDSFVRLIPFKDHINVESQAISKHTKALIGYKITPKCMLQIYANQPIPTDILKLIFNEALKQ